MPFVIISLLVAFTVHEFAHAYTAYKFGDDTAKDQGRLTLNPVHHLDPIGTLFILLAGFGWARPVPVNRRNFANPKLAGVLVSLAGPLSNFLIAFIAFGILFFIIGSAPSFAIELLNMMVWLNVLLFVFNLLPFPPLDGYRIIEDLAPPHTRMKMTQYEQYGVLLFLILVITPLGDYSIHPFLSVMTRAVMTGFQSIFSIFL
ncbi:site-2 protease family protein [Domibacillus epiphyticus]|uniref:Site-2 protease family protein n=1 Tax=Domibacillus epiphyticus TaxID=1714355 RepID=A0A1V2A702_9BACI|nr:site-2 protease family protein [Domibacillus epiphyticus]OMP66710.1 site-2 protease family protein [Domibacillus epiphyticus]